MNLKVLQGYKMKMFLLFSHKLTSEQIKDAKENLGVKEFVYLPKDLQERFSNVPPEIDDIKEYSKIFINFLEKNASSEDYVLIQGDFGIVFWVVEYCRENNLKAVYATTKRVVKEEVIDGKVIKISEFKHVRFRYYFRREND